MNIPKLPWKKSPMWGDWIAETRIGDFGVYRFHLDSRQVFAFFFRGNKIGYKDSVEEAKAAAQAYFEDLLTNPI